MARKPLVRTNLFPYHVVNRTIDHEFFKLPMLEVWEMFSTSCFEATLVNGARFHAVVLMSNHFHIMLSTTTHDLGQVMSRLEGALAQTPNPKTRPHGHLFFCRFT